MAALLIGLFGVLFLPAAASVEPTAIFTAYDCSQPQSRIALQPPGPEACEDRVDLAKQEGATYVVLQRAQFRRMTVRSCHGMEAVTSYFCGSHDHMTMIVQLSHGPRPIQIASSDCQRYWDNMQYVVDRRDAAPITLSVGTNYLQYMLRGRLFPSDSGTNYHCNGDKAWIGEIEQYQVVSVANVILTLREEDATADEHGKVIISRTSTILPCLAHEEKCVDTSRTYIWSQDASVCQLFQTRVVTGIRVSTDDADTNRPAVSMFLSTDGSMIRLKMKAPVSECGAVTYPTNYKRLFLSANVDAAPFQLHLPPAEMSITTYANQQDDFLWGRMTAYIREEFHAVMRRDCLRARREDRAAYAQLAAEHRAVLDGETTALGAGQFATAAGEVWYQYRCRTLNVTERAADLCYAALPVTLHGVDAERLATAAALPGTRLPEHHKPMFLEAHSRRLTSIGIEMPCSAVFQPRYKTIAGRWLAATPQPRYVAAPNAPERENGSIKLPELPQFDFESGGIYTAAAVAAMDKFVQAPRAAQDIAYAFAEQTVRNPEDGSGLRITNVFPHVPALSFFTKVWTWLERWGQLASILLGLFVLVKFVLSATGFLFRLLTVHRAVGCGRSLCCALLPSMAWWQTQRKAPTSARDHLDAPYVAVVPPGPDVAYAVPPYAAAPEQPLYPQLDAITNRLQAAVNRLACVKAAADE